jgi:hypothetical protein
MIGIAGGGAFGTALAMALPGRVVLWARDPARVRTLRPEVDVTQDLRDLNATHAVLLCVPMQALPAFLAGANLDGKRLIACCKGIDLTSLKGPSSVIASACPNSLPAVLTGPSFATDIAAGLPTALTLACADEAIGIDLQSLLSNATLRLYRTTDVIGAELGGALKNVVAIAAGVVMGAGLGQSARAALMTRGFAEMQRLAQFPPWAGDRGRSEPGCHSHGRRCRHCPGRARPCRPDGDRYADHRYGCRPAGRPAFHRAGCAKSAEPTFETGVTPCVSPSSAKTNPGACKCGWTIVQRI